jgi:hypothetical protein
MRFIFMSAVDPARLCRHCASGRFCDVTEDVFIVPSSEVARRARCHQACRAIVAAEAVLREPRKRKLTQEGIRTIAKTEERRGDIRRVACIDVSFT